MRFSDYRPPADLLAGRVLLVTGAGQGLGREAALACARHGAAVILHGRRQARLEAVYDEIAAAGLPQPAMMPLDLETADDAAYESLAGVIQAEFGRLDGILHCAAHLDRLSPLEQQTGAQWRAALQVNLVAPFALTRACLPLLKASPDASVVMTLESHGLPPAAYWGAFGVAKQGLLGLVRMFGEEMAGYPDLRFNAFLPGPVHSPQRLRTHPGEDKASMRQPADLAAAWLWLLGPASRGRNGELIRLDGAGE